MDLVLQSFPHLRSEIKSSTERTRKSQTHAKKKYVSFGLGLIPHSVVISSSTDST